MAGGNWQVGSPICHRPPFVGGTRRTRPTLRLRAHGMYDGVLMATILEALTMAVRHHQAGHWQAAEEIYRQPIAIEPAEQTPGASWACSRPSLDGAKPG